MYKIHARPLCTNDLQYNVPQLDFKKVEKYLSYSQPLTKTLNFTTQNKHRVSDDYRCNYGMEIISLDDSVNITCGDTVVSAKRLIIGLMVFQDIYFTSNVAQEVSLTYRLINCEQWLKNLIYELSPYIDSGLIYMSGMASPNLTLFPDQNRTIRCSIGVAPSGKMEEYINYRIYSCKMEDLMAELQLHSEWIHKYPSYLGASYPPSADYVIYTKHEQDFIDFLRESVYMVRFTSNGHPKYQTDSDICKGNNLSAEATDKIYRLYRKVMYDETSGLFDEDIPHSAISKQ